jgi:hypothetical protein
MKLYVPEIGDKLKLESDWTFDLHWEHRNKALISHFFGEDFAWRAQKAPRPVTLPKGTVLTVDRIYIRQGASEYSSISFYASIGASGKSSFGKPKSPRFWATLKDCNKIEFDLEKTEPVMKLVFNVNEVKDGWITGGYEPNLSSNNIIKEGHCYRVITALRSVPILKIKLEYNIEWEKKSENSMFGKTYGYFQGTMRNPKYTLYSMEGEELGSWKSYASLKKNAKELATKL